VDDQTLEFKLTARLTRGERRGSDHDKENDTNQAEPSESKMNEKKGPAEASLEPSPSGGEIEVACKSESMERQQTNASMHRFIDHETAA
jgi:hypothetical protein